MTSYDTSPGTLVWSSNPLANRALHISGLAYVALTRAAVQQDIYDLLCDRALPEDEPARGREVRRREAVRQRCEKAHADADTLLSDSLRIESALEVADPALAEAVSLAIWERPTPLVTTEGHLTHA